MFAVYAFKKERDIVHVLIELARFKKESQLIGFLC